MAENPRTFTTLRTEAQLDAELALRSHESGRH